MKIKDEMKPTLTFRDLELGDCFKLLGHKYHYLKMDDIYDEDGEVRYNAVFLENGDPTYFTGDEEVVFIEAEFVIK